MVPFEHLKTLIELGAGTGVLSAELLHRKKRETQFLMLEPDDEFFAVLKKKFSKEEHTEVIQELAENLPSVISAFGIKKVNCVVSSLPFALISNKVSATILAAIAEILAPGGRFVFYQYTLFRLPLILKYFKIERFAFTALNAPPAFVFLCSARQKG